MEIWLDNNLISNHDHIMDSTRFSHKLSDSAAEHELRFVMKNKTAEHTTVDASGTIIKDSYLMISDLAFDEIELGHMVPQLATYNHNFNGTGQATQEKFYGTMGCNGTVTLKFTTPIYLWLLENM